MFQHLRPRRSAAVALATVGIAGSVLGGLAAAGSAVAAAPHAHPDGFVTVDSCTAVSGNITYSPGLRKVVARQVTGVLSGRVSGCSDGFSGAMAGTGSVTAVLSGKASLAAENFTGTFTINWPGGSLNPSNGTLNVRAVGAKQYAVSGTVTSGADTGSVLSFGYLTTTQKGIGGPVHPVVSQQFVNTSPLALARNFG